MEFFTKTRAVKLKSHLNKYLIAGDDRSSTRQSRSGGGGRKARWIVELVGTNPHVVRLRSCHGRYLTASNEPFLLGMTGRKVLQTLPEDAGSDLSIVWQPIRDGFQVKLKAAVGETYLRANGGTPPWRNSVTHDSPHAAAMHDWVVWDVEAVEVPEDEAAADYWSMVSSFSAVSDEISGLGIGPDSAQCSPSGSPSPSPSPRWLSLKKSPLQYSFSRATAMDLFQNVDAVLLKSIHGKYLTAADDAESVTQSRRRASSRSAYWTVELVDTSDTVIRLRSCHGGYLTASNRPFLLGMTGRKVLQTLPPGGRLDSSVEWEPIRENGAVKLKTRYGNYLRANFGMPPWKDSVTHDIPHRTATQDWLLWEVHAVKEDSLGSGSSSPSTSQSSKSASFCESPKVSEGRLIYFHISDEFGDIDERFEELCITFKGNEVKELTKRLEDELGVDNITVCTRSPLDGKIYPMRLQLPPNNTTMHVVVVPRSPAGDNNTYALIIKCCVRTYFAHTSFCGCLLCQPRVL